MLLTKEVEVNLKGSKRIQYYKNKGYNIPMKHSNFYKKEVVDYSVPLIVKTEDLPCGSEIKVLCSCDYKGCDKLSEMTYQNYLKRNHKGKTYCHEHAMRVLCSSENHYRWNFNKTKKERENGRVFQEYHNFIQKVLIRDNYTCKCCGLKRDNKNVIIEVHHLNGYDWYKEGRTDETNAICLCKNCHTNFHIKYGRGNNTKEQFEEWIGEALQDLQKYNGELPNARWCYCIEDKIIIKNIKDYALKNNFDNARLYDCCYGKKINTYKGKHYIWYDIYKEMSQEDLLEWLCDKLKNERPKYVICLNNKKVFRGAPIAAKHYGLKSPSGIQSCCLGINKSSGKNPITNEPLKWKHLDVYIKENGIEEYYKLIKEGLLEI